MKNTNGDKLPDTQWHIGYTKMDENDHRRSKFRCVYFNDYICINHGLRCDGRRCGGSSHCPGYADSEIIQQREQEGQYSYEDYLSLRRTGLEDRKKRIARSYYPICHRPVEFLEKCLVCNEIPVNVEGVAGLRKCPSCGMYYGNYTSVVNDPQVRAVIKDEPVFIMKKPKKKKKPESHEIQVVTRPENMNMCKYTGKVRKCNNVPGDMYGKKCNRQKCSWWQNRKTTIISR